MRRRRDNGSGGDYDSVLDTMTNVVGILIIVVAVTQLNVSSAVGRARTAMVASGEAIDHPPVSDEVLEAAKRARDETKKRLGALAGVTDGSGSGDGISEAEWQELKERLKKSLPTELKPKIEREIRRLRTRIKSIDAETSQLGEQKVRIMELIDKLEAELAALKAGKAKLPPPIDVRLPDPDAGRVSNLRLRKYLVKRGRLYQWETMSVLENWANDIEVAQKAIPRYAATAKARLEWLADRWNRKGFSNGTVRLRFKVVRNSSLTGGWDLLRIEELAPSATGESLASIQRSNSSYRRTLRQLRPSRHWLFFYVFDDSFETYIAARAIAEEGGLNVGWEAFGRTQLLQASLLQRGNARDLESD